MSAPGWTVRTQVRAPWLFGGESELRHLALSADQPLLLWREPANPVDPENAVVLADLLGTPVGYVQRSTCREVARRLDGGEVLLGRVLAPARPIRVHWPSGNVVYAVATAVLWSDGGRLLVEEDSREETPLDARVPEEVS